MVVWPWRSMGVICVVVLQHWFEIENSSLQHRREFVCSQQGYGV